MEFDFEIGADPDSDTDPDGRKEDVPVGFMLVLLDGHLIPPVEPMDLEEKPVPDPLAVRFDEPEPEGHELWTVVVVTGTVLVAVAVSVTVVSYTVVVGAAKTASRAAAVSTVVTEKAYAPE